MVVENYVLSPQWIWAAVALLPLIILYFLRPSPKKQTIPSLMFLLRDKKKKRLRGFLQKFMPNVLFLIQFLLLTLLIFSLVQPYLNIPLIQTAQETIIILDDSASMHVQEEQGMRYELAKDEVTSLVGSSNTVILAGSSAEIVLEEANAADTREFIRSWEPSHQPTQLRIALQEALSRVTEQTAVIIASDFIDTEPQSSPSEALNALRARAGDVRQVQVGTPITNNIGIIDVDASDIQTTIAVKNFDTQSRSTQACVAGVCNEFNLEAQETQEWTFQTPQGISEVQLQVEDAFAIDNTVYVGAEEDNQIDVLVVTNSDFTDNSVYQVLQALGETSVLDIQITTNTPPDLVDVTQDVIIFSDIQSNLVVQRTMRQAEERVRNGAASIILYQPGLFDLPYQELLPVTYVDQGSSTPVLNTNTQQRFVGFQYGTTPQHFVVEAKEQTTVLARGSLEQPLIVTQPLDAGRTLYYGIPETASFSQSPDYPLFWKNVLDGLLQRLSASQRTRSTGSLITANQEIQLPTGQRETGRIRLSYIGLYQSEQTTIVANLNNAAESDIRTRTSELQPTALSTGVAQTTPRTYTTEILLALLLLLFVELGYMKYRGDI